MRVAERRGVVGQARAVRRADLDQPRAGLRDDLGDPEARRRSRSSWPRETTSSRPAGERGGREQHRGGAVVDRERRLGAGQLAQQRLDVVVARAALARRRGRARGSRSPRPPRATAARAVGGERRAAEVRVHDDAGRVEHAPQRRRAAAPRARATRSASSSARAGEQLGAALGELGPGHRGRQPVDRRQRPQALARLGGGVARSAMNRCSRGGRPIRTARAANPGPPPRSFLSLGSVGGTPRAPAASLRRRGSCRVGKKRTPARRRPGPVKRRPGSPSLLAPSSGFPQCTHAAAGPGFYVSGGFPALGQPDSCESPGRLSGRARPGRTCSAPTSGARAGPAASPSARAGPARRPPRTRPGPGGRPVERPRAVLEAPGPNVVDRLAEPRVGRGAVSAAAARK